MKCFDYIDTGREYGKDYQHFTLSMRSLELRLSRWWDVARLGAGNAHMSEDEKKPYQRLARGDSIGPPGRTEEGAQVQADIDR
jgi:hypothetical protein